jgi:predicted RecA/RadA family phage recombinase
MANNEVMPFAEHLTVICTDPAAPAAGAPCRVGSMTGVALTTEDAAGLTTIDIGMRVWDLPVTDHAGTTIAPGDALFYVDATDALENDPTGFFFGIAIEAVGNGLTATINVLHVPSPGAGTVGAGTIGTAGLAAGTISADAPGRALMAANYFTTAQLLNALTADSITNAVLLDGVLDGAFLADAGTRALFTAGIWTEPYLAAESVTGAKVAEAASSSVIGAVPLLYHTTIADIGAPTNYDITVTSKIHVVDAWIHNTGLAAHNTDDKLQLANTAAAITNEIAKTNVVNAVKRATTMDPANQDIANGGILRWIATKSTNVACEAYVLAYRVA